MTLLKKKTKVSEVKEAIEDDGEPLNEKEVFDPTRTLSSGSTLLDLAMTESEGGFVQGKVVNLIGDSHAGKSLLALTMLAEAAHDPKYDEYDLIYDDVEAASEMNLAVMFGKKTAKRIMPPFTYKDGTNGQSDAIQDFYANLKNAIKRGNPFVYVLDSFDALTSLEEQERADKEAEAFEAGTKVKGSYKMEKPKIVSEILRVVKKDLQDLNSILIVISQTRDDINPMTFTKKTRSGGRALKFYSTHEIWLAVGKKIKKKERTIGAEVIAKITKNKITGKSREVMFPIYTSYGVDDIGSCIQFLIEEGVITGGKKKKDKDSDDKGKGKTLKFPELDFEGTQAKLIQMIEDDPKLLKKLRKITKETWMDIEDSIKVDRKPKYE